MSFLSTIVTLCRRIYDTIKNDVEEFHAPNSTGVLKDAVKDNIKSLKRLESSADRVRTLAKGALDRLAHLDERPRR